jgi:hypothetical protein
MKKLVVPRKKKLYKYIIYNSFYNNMRTEQVSYKHEDRQWDARFNVQSDEYLGIITESIKAEEAKGKFKWVIIGGCEIGTKPSQDDYKVRHIHVGVIFNNRASKASIIKNWGIVEGNGYYLVPRNRDLPYVGWRNHHVKVDSKVDTDALLIYEAGELPKDTGEKRSWARSEAEKKETTDVILKKMRVMIEEDREKEAFELYPRTYLQYGEKLKSLVTQKKPTTKRAHPHLWIHGFPGTGKTAILNFVYPRTYKKDLNNRFFDLYKEEEHDHIMLEDLDHATVDKLGIQFLKTICDESGFPIDQKYKTPQITKTTVLVTSNFDINAVVPEGKGVDETKMALHRRFLQVRVDDFLRLLGLKLIPPYERKQLKLKGNTNPAAVFMTWDYYRNTPTGEEVQSSEYYQDLLLGYYYG